MNVKLRSVLEGVGLGAVMLGMAIFLAFMVEVANANPPRTLNEAIANDFMSVNDRCVGLLHGGEPDLDEAESAIAYYFCVARGYETMGKEAYEDYAQDRTLTPPAERPSEKGEFLL